MPLTPGDLLFWTGDGSLSGRLIQFATHGPYVHVSVVSRLDGAIAYDIGAHSEDGIQERTVPVDGRGIDVVSVFHLVACGRLSGTPEEARGLAFLRGEIGNRYGWCNIANNALKALNLPYRLSRVDRYDCSSLVARYLEKIGCDTGDLGEEPDSVSPNDLARWTGLLRY